MDFGLVFIQVTEMNQTAKSNVVVAPPSQCFSSLWTMQLVQLVFSVCLYRGFAKPRKALVDDSDHAPLDENLSDSNSVDHTPHGELDYDEDLRPDDQSTAEDGLQQTRQ